MTMRSVQDRFWADGWIRKLNPLDRYLFLYLLTNEHTNWCGVYELEIGMMAYESGLDERDLERSFLPRLTPKIIYVDGWIYVPNWVKHHQSESGNLSPSQKKGIEEAWNKVPEKIRLRIKEIEVDGIPYAYPMLGVSASASSLSSAYIGGETPQIVKVSQEGEERPKRESTAKYPHAKEVFGWFPNPQPSWLINTTELKHAELLYFRGESAVRGILKFVAKHKDDEYFPKVVKPSDLERKWEDIAAFKV